MRYYEIIEKTKPAEKCNVANIDQQISSAGSSRRIIPATVRRVEWRPRTRNVDIGGGRFDDATRAMAERGVVNLVYDPFNRSPQHNMAVLQELQDQPADTATINNVLNVIREPQIRAMVIDQAARLIVPNGTAYFLIYAGDKSGIGKITRRICGKAESWQNNRSASSYVNEIKYCFYSVKLCGNLITATEPKLK